MSLFDRYIGMDYSGAETPETSLFGLRVYIAEGKPPPRGKAATEPPEVLDAQRAGRVALAILQEMSKNHRRHRSRLFIPPSYFDRYKIKQDWDAFLDDFCDHWPTDAPHIYVDFIRDGLHGKGSERQGNSAWLRITEKHAPGTQSVFKFDVQGSVAKSTFAGIPWLRDCEGRMVHLSISGPLTVGYPQMTVMSLQRCILPSFVADILLRTRHGHQQDAYATCRWLQEMDHYDYLPRFFDPPLTPDERKAAAVEGWILGVS